MNGILMEALWTIEETAEYFKVKESVIRYWMRSTGLPYIKLGKHPRFDPVDVKKWIKFYKSASYGVDADGEFRRIT